MTFLRARRPTTDGRTRREQSDPSASIEHFLLATESAPFAVEIRALLETLLARVSLEVLPEEGPLLLSRLHGEKPRLTFLPMRLRHLEALTLLRALGPSAARNVVLLVPDTLEGYGVAWDALEMGVCDFLVTRGRSVRKLKGELVLHLRRLAHLLAETEAEQVPVHPHLVRGAALSCARERALEGEEQLGTLIGASKTEVNTQAPEGTPWIILPESRHLRRVAAALDRLPKDCPVVLRVPEGPKLRRVVRRELEQACSWPARDLVDGDRLSLGQVHLFSEPETLWLEPAENRIIARLESNRGISGSWVAWKNLLARLGDCSVPLRVLLGQSIDADEIAWLLGQADHGRLLYSLTQPGYDALSMASAPRRVA